MSDDRSGNRRARPLSESEQEMARQMGLLNATLDATRDGVLVIDLDGKMVIANDVFARLWRIPHDILQTGDDDRMLNHVLDQLVDPDGFVEKVRRLYAETRNEDMDEIVFLDGRIFERFTRPVLVDGVPAARIWVFRDVTRQRASERDRSALEEQLRQSQKMEAVGKLAGGVAHDFNNLLTAILGHTELLSGRVPDLPELGDGLEQIRRAAQRAADLTQQLLALSRRQIRRPRVIDLADTVRDVARMLRRLIGESIHLQTRYCEEPAVVRADPSQLEQVLLNLTVNARDAMPRGGILTLETAVVEVTENRRHWYGDLMPGRHVLLTVSDTGIGMDEETLRHAFEPFFTTKREGDGTGLGLSTAYGVIKQSAGHIAIESRPGEGTTVRIYLPQVADEPEGRTARGVADSSLVGDETVLVAEDEKLVRSMVKEALTLYGYRVLTAEHGAAALECSRLEEGTIHLLVSDVVMPGISGIEVCEKMVACRPGLKVLFMSGYERDVVDHLGTLPAGAGFIQKPFSSRELVKKVREILGTEVLGTDL